MKQLKLFLPILILLLSLGCKKEIQLEGSIRGSVLKYTDQYGNIIDLEGIRVELKGDNASFTNYTNDLGIFEFDSILTGNYELTIGKFAPYKYYINFVGGNEPFLLSPIYLTEKSSNSVSIYDYSSDNYFLQIDLALNSNSNNNDYQNVLLKSREFKQYYKVYYNNMYSTYRDIIEMPLDYLKIPDTIIIYPVSFGDYSLFVDTLGNIIDPTIGVYSDTLIIL